MGAHNIHVIYEAICSTLNSSSIAVDCDWRKKFVKKMRWVFPFRSRESSFLQNEMFGLHRRKSLLILVP